ncbi:MAG: hypothetical protein P1V35_05330 [Planctomycetota bacterium]|nr:hypothetical protein [Planctomycetota bacterium]
MDPNKRPRYESAQKPLKCPACAEPTVATVVYGLIDPEGWEKLRKKGHYVSGGCCVSDDNPTWSCSSCHVDIHRPFHGS